MGFRSLRFRQSLTPTEPTPHDVSINRPSSLSISPGVYSPPMLATNHSVESPMYRCTLPNAYLMEERVLDILLLFFFKKKASASSEPPLPALVLTLERRRWPCSIGARRSLTLTFSRAFLSRSFTSRNRRRSLLLPSFIESSVHLFFSHSMKREVGSSQVFGLSIGSKAC